jgi:hypothetical protein
MNRAARGHGRSVSERLKLGAGSSFGFRVSSDGASGSELFGGALRRRAVSPLWVIAALWWLPVLEAADVRVSHWARALHPGEVVMLTLEASVEIESARAQAFDRSFPMFPTSDARRWEGLVGVDLATAPGSYGVRVTARAGGSSLEEVHTLRIEPKEFPVRRITVEERYVTPPAAELERIQRERELVSGIFAETTPRRFWEGPFLRPVPGEATSSFGRRSIINNQPRSPHGGTDFRAATGTPIKAPNAGRVVLVRDLYFAGNTVIVDHGLGLYTYFAHLSEFRVEEGALVRKGDVVGLVGATGRVTGPHLHWTTRLVGSLVDPISLMEVTDSVEGRDGG